MKIEAIWQELEAEHSAGARGAWLSRFALPDPRNALLVAVEYSSGARALLLPLSTAAMPTRRDWPQCRGLELFAVQIDGVAYLGVRLLDKGYSDVFTALAEDIAPRVALAMDEKAAAHTLLERVRRWQKFLTASAEGLSVARQRGLFGELHLLRHMLLPAIGAELSVTSWRASLAAHQDFQFASAAVEVKTTTAKQPQDVCITSERQLDGTGTPALFLFVAVFDEREVEGNEDAPGETLPATIAALREILGTGGALRDTFDDRLLDAGYLDADAARFEWRRFTPRSHQCFEVTAGFPRLLEADLPVGVGDISYALSLAACAPFGVSVDAMITAIQSSSAHKQD
jgi:hypothetical protein